jgi:hypothetical protein
MFKKIEIQTLGKNNIKIEHDKECIILYVKVDVEELLQEFTIKEIVGNLHDIELKEMFDMLKTKFT